MQQTKNDTRVDSRASVGMVVGIVGAALIFLSLILSAVAVFAMKAAQ